MKDYELFIQAPFQFQIRLEENCFDNDRNVSSKQQHLQDGVGGFFLQQSMLAIWASNSRTEQLVGSEANK